MSMETRIREKKMVFGDWKVGQYIGSGSGGKTAVYYLTRRHQKWEERSVLKIINILEEIGHKCNLDERYLKEYEAECKELCAQAEKELQLMSCLKGSPYIVECYDFDFVEYQEENAFGMDLLIRMEPLVSLREEQKRREEFQEPEVIRIGEDICRALITCHEAGILHRDIKPANIFISPEGTCKLGDFGIARMMDAGQKASTRMGTRAYAAPEQFIGKEEKYDNRVDLYSLGLTLYELSNHNRLPFASSGYVRESEIQMRIMGKELPNPEQAGKALAEVIRKACAYKAENRYQTAEEFLRALQAAEVGALEEIGKEKPVSRGFFNRYKRDRKGLYIGKKRITVWIAAFVLVILLFIPIDILVIRHGVYEDKFALQTEAKVLLSGETVVLREAVEVSRISDGHGTEASEGKQDEAAERLVDFSSEDEKIYSIIGNSSQIVTWGETIAVITRSGDLYTWGENSNGQTGCGNKEYQEEPVLILRDVASVELTDFNGAALTNSGILYMWGDNSNLQLGPGVLGKSKFSEQLIPVEVLTDVKEFAISNCRSSLALLNNGDLYGWGNPNGNGTGEESVKPALILQGVREIDLGFYTGGAVTNQGDLYMWGLNNKGTVGTGDTEPQLTPAKIMSDVESVCLGDSVSACITIDKDLYTWGINGHGQVGVKGVTTSVLTPTKILKNVKEVFLTQENGMAHSAAITIYGSLWMWGENSNSQLGLKEMTLYKEPTFVCDSVKTVVLGQRHTAIISKRGDLYLCGDNGKKQISESDAKKIKRPEFAAKEVSDVALTLDKTYVIDNNGRFYCWGD